MKLTAVVSQVFLSFYSSIFCEEEHKNWRGSIRKM